MGFNKSQQQPVEGNMKKKLNDKPRIQKHYERLTMIKRFTKDLVAVPAKFNGNPCCMLCIWREDDESVDLIPLARLLDADDMDDIDGFDMGLGSAFKEAFESIDEMDERTNIEEFNESPSDLFEVFTELSKILKESKDV